MPLDDVGDGVLADAEIRSEPTPAPRGADGMKQVRGEPGHAMAKARRFGTARFSKNATLGAILMMPAPEPPKLGETHCAVSGCPPA